MRAHKSVEPFMTVQNQVMCKIWRIWRFNLRIERLRFAQIACQESEYPGNRRVGNGEDNCFRLIHSR